MRRSVVCSLQPDVEHVGYAAAVISRDANVSIETDTVLSKTEKDTMRRNCLCLDSSLRRVVRIDQSMIDPLMRASRA